jgi:hypothetical protein
MRAAPEAACASKSTRVSNQGHTASTGIPYAMVLNGLYVISPVTCLVATVARETRERLHDLSACVGAPEPHDFAVRCNVIRPRKKLRLMLPRPSQFLRVRDDRDTPSGERNGTNEATDLG